MNTLLLLILFLNLVVATHSAVFFDRQLPLSGYQNLCYDKEENIFYKKGEEMIWRLKGCGRKICKGFDEKKRIYTEIQTCEKVEVPPECHVKVNLDLAFPECCERVICPDLSV